MKIKGLSIKNNVLKFLSIVVPITLSVGLLVFLIVYPAKRNRRKISSFSYSTSHDSGIYEESISFKIKPSNPNFEIRYTLDG